MYGSDVTRVVQRITMKKLSPPRPKFLEMAPIRYCVASIMSWILLFYTSPGETVRTQDSSRTITNITFISFVPSLHSIELNENISPSSWSLLDEYDLLSSAAISLAIDRVNRDDHILANYILDVTAVSSEGSALEFLLVRSG